MENTIPRGTLSILPLSSLFLYYLLSCPLFLSFFPPASSSFSSFTLLISQSTTHLLYSTHTKHFPHPRPQALRTEGRKARKQVLECVGLVRDLVYLVQLDARTSDQSEEHSKVRTGWDCFFTCSSSVLLSLAEKLNFICM